MFSSLTIYSVCPEEELFLSALFYEVSSVILALRDDIYLVREATVS